VACKKGETDQVLINPVLTTYEHRRNLLGGQGENPPPIFLYLRIMFLAARFKKGKLIIGVRLGERGVCLLRAGSK
jgi:hypothetical protein